MFRIPAALTAGLLLSGCFEAETHLMPDSAKDPMPFAHEIYIKEGSGEHYQVSGHDSPYTVTLTSKESSAGYNVSGDYLGDSADGTGFYLLEIDDEAGRIVYELLLFNPDGTLSKIGFVCDTAALWGYKGFEDRGDERCYFDDYDGLRKAAISGEFFDEAELLMPM